MKAGYQRSQTAMHRVLAQAPREPKAWLRPTFLVSRGVYYDGNRKVELPPVYIAVLHADEHTATYEVLGCSASPATIDRETLATMLRERGVQQ